MINNIEYIHDNIGFIKLVDRMQNDTSLKVVNSARISHASESKEFDSKDKKLCGYLFEHDHTSPFRHTYYTFHIKAPIFCFNQWKKYQVGSTWRTYEADGVTLSVDIFDEMYDTDKGCSWNEISGRYTELKPEFYFPKVMRGPVAYNKQASTPFDDKHKSDRLLRIMQLRCNTLYQAYLDDLKSNVAKEIARMTLPLNIYSQSYWTVSTQALMHFFDQRLKSDAQKEIQEYAKCTYNLVSDDFEKLGIEFYGN